MILFMYLNPCKQTYLSAFEYVQNASVFIPVSLMLYESGCLPCDIKSIHSVVKIPGYLYSAHA